jgi:large subunit ribosomal protein L28
MKRRNKRNTSIRTLRCFDCGKSTLSGRAVSHSKRHTLKTWHANLQKVHVTVDGIRRHVNACTRCLRSGVVKKAI